jgi:hypothetical protein
MAVPIGTVWDLNTWADDAWGLDTWADASAPLNGVAADSPTFLQNSYEGYVLTLDPDGDSPTTLLLDPDGSIGTTLTFYRDDGTTEMNPLLFKVGETGALAMTLAGVNGTVEDLTGNQSVVLNVVSTNGTVLVAARALTVVSAADGQVSWTRTAPDVATAGDYLAEVTVVRSDSTTGKFPDQANGAPMTILPGLV